MKRLKALLVFAVFLMLMPTIKCSAGFLTGDEALGGLSYMLDCAYENKMPEGPYRNLYYQAYMMFHYEYVISDEARQILERIVEAEATDGTVKQKMNVASCVLARVESDEWPNDIKSVVFQKQQFTPTFDGRYYSVTITDSTRKAVENVLKNGKTHDCLWFCSDKSYKKKNAKGEYISYHRLHHTWVFYDGEHHYFYD